MILLRTRMLDVAIDPSNGAEIVSVVDQQSGISFLASAPEVRTRPVRGDLSVTDWVAGYRGGWQILTPNAGDPCVVDGTPHGFHGRASNEPWEVEFADSASARLVWSGHGLQVARVYEVAESTLSIETTWTTTAGHPVPMVHVEHLALGVAFLADEVVIQIPATLEGAPSSTIRIDSNRPATTFDVLGPFKVGEVEIATRSQDLRATLKWDVDQLPYLWLWHESQAADGVWGETARVLGLEPASVGHDHGLARAVEVEQATWVAPMETVRRKVSLEIHASAFQGMREPRWSIIGADTLSRVEIDSGGAFGETRVVDAHHHFWDLNRNTYPWLEDPGKGSPEELITQRYFTYDASNYFADIAPLPVVASVHVEANWDSDDPVAETTWLQGLHETVGWPSAIVGAVRLESPDAEQLLLAHSRHSAFRGVRDQLGWHAAGPGFQIARADHLMSDDSWRSGFGLLEPLGLSFDLHVYPHQLLEAADLASAFPNTEIVLNHCASPDEVKPDRQIWREGLRSLAECDNVSVKLSGITHPYRPIQAVHEYVAEVIEAFGCDRTMFGSNLPVEELGGSLNVLVDAVRLALTDRTSRQRNAVWGNNAARVYRLESPTESEPNS